MDFFEHQDVARRRTGRLVLYLILAVAAIVVALYFVALMALTFVGGSGRPGQPNPYAESPFHPGLFAVVALATIGLILLASLYKTSQLSAGGEAVALMLGGRPLASKPRDLAERRLLNVVEEMALASGVPVPPVYVMDNEQGINAFAAGHEPGDAVIGVTRGCIEYLDRDELQGVMAHEFSHILNGDMRLNLRLVGVLHGILVLAIVGWYVLHSMRFSGGRSRGKGGGGAMAAILMVAVGLLVIGSIGLFFGKLIKSAVSRQREYLADASAVQFTRLPGGIAGALKKIGGLHETSKVEDVHAGEISHMFFGSAAGSFAFQLFGTHPPLDERIRRIDPSFDGRFPKRVEPVAVTRESLKPADQRKRERPFGPLRPGDATPLDPAGVLRNAGFPGAGRLLLAAAMLEAVPEPLDDAAREPYGARAVIYAVLLDADPEMRRRQLDALSKRAEELSYRETERLAALIDELPEGARLPLVEMAFPALRQLSPDQYAAFRENVDTLIRADEKVDLLEYSVRTMLLRSLDVPFGLAAPIIARQRRLDPLLPSLLGVLSTLAHVGHKEEADARRAFEKGMAEVGRRASLLPGSDCSLRNFDAALKTLAEAVPKLKRQILGACVACVAADGRVTPRESQLVQTIAALLGVPLPPIGAGGREGGRD